MASTVSKSKRFNEIFRIMLEHRLTQLVKDLVELARRPPDAHAPSPNGVGPASAPARVRRLLEDLGPTFIKIGQLLGTRPDMIPAPFVAEFKKMYDQAPPTPFPQVRKMVESELGRRLESVFSEFSEVPVASASIAQVHRAKLSTGETVAVKVQHPGSEERMRVDFEILSGIVRFTERVFAATRVYQPSRHLLEIRKMLNQELDFRNEIRIQTQIEGNFRAVPEVKIPHVFQEFSSRRLMAMEFIDGVKFHERETLQLTPEEGRNLARIITDAMAKQIFVDRLFHADPSPGNLLILSPNQICLIDFGAVGQVTKRRVNLILDFLGALNVGNPDDAVRVILELCEVRGEYDLRRLRGDTERAIEYYETNGRRPADPVLLEMIVGAANRHGLLLPSDFMLITRSLYQFEGMCRDLDPSYDLVEVVTPFIRRTVRERILSPELHPEQFVIALQDVARVAAGLPARIDRLLAKAEKGELATRMEVAGLEDYKRHVATVSYLASFAVLLGLGVVSATLGFALAGAPGLRIALTAVGAAVLLWAFMLAMARISTARAR